MKIAIATFAIMFGLNTFACNCDKGAKKSCTEKTCGDKDGKTCTDKPSDKTQKPKS